MDQVNFNPNSHLVVCLWICEFHWITPDLPSGTSIFFCLETSSINSKELERERSFALADKIKQDDIDKLPKQKLSFPTTIMEAIWMTQNFYSLLSICFGPQFRSALFLKSWADHMYRNRIMYKSLQATDNTFFSQVLFAIDRALQIHWRSCCDASDRDSVNDKILLMQDKQDLIIQHNFSYRLPKSLQDKLNQRNETSITTPEKESKNKFRQGAKNDGKPDHKNQIRSLKDIITDPDPSHMQWRIKEGENFTKNLYFNSKKCQKGERMNLNIEGRDQKEEKKGISCGLRAQYTSPVLL